MSLTTADLIKINYSCTILVLTLFYYRVRATRVNLHNIHNSDSFEMLTASFRAFPRKNIRGLETHAPPENFKFETSNGGI